jgi:hypothetical protein
MWTFNPKRGDPPIVKRSHVPIEKKTVRLCAWRFPYSWVLLRWGSGTLSGGPPSLPRENPHLYTQISSPYLTRTHTRTHKFSSPYLTYENPHSYTNLSPLTTFKHDKKPYYFKLTTTEIDSPPASQPDGQKRPGCDHPPKVHGKNDYFWWKFGDKMICHYLHTFTSGLFFSFFFLLGSILVVLFTTKICGIFFYLV